MHRQQPILNQTIDLSQSNKLIRLIKSNIDHGMKHKSINKDLGIKRLPEFHNFIIKLP